ncbi:hypothetical protein J6590_067218 [Homalodisca vitripennis]|nr:hypothetical protein J6590_067218 [Homalodisca vitripennis]
MSANFTLAQTLLGLISAIHFRRPHAVNRIELDDESVITELGQTVRTRVTLPHPIRDVRCCQIVLSPDRQISVPFSISNLGALKKYESSL